MLSFLSVMPLFLLSPHQFFFHSKFKRAVEGHFSHPKQREWKDIATHAATHLAPLIGG